MSVKFSGIVCDSLKFDSKPAGFVKVTLVADEVNQWVQLLIGGDGINEAFSIEFSLLFDMPVNLTQGFVGFNYADKVIQSWSSLKIESTQDAFVTTRRAEAQAAARSSLDAVMINVPCSAVRRGGSNEVSMVDCYINEANAVCIEQPIKAPMGLERVFQQPVPSSNEITVKVLTLDQEPVAVKLDRNDSLAMAKVNTQLRFLHLITFIN